MRPYKGKAIDTGEWVYGQKLQSKLGTYIVTEENPHECTQYGYITIEEYYKVDPTTVGQDTGMVDSVEATLFEGDIIHVSYKGGGSAEGISAITYDYGSYMFMERSPFAPVYYKTALRAVIAHSNYCVTKIGNIHDNPELLGVE